MEKRPLKYGGETTIACPGRAEVARKTLPLSARLSPLTIIAVKGSAETRLDVTMRATPSRPASSQPEYPGLAADHTPLHTLPSVALLCMRPLLTSSKRLYEHRADTWPWRVKARPTATRLLWSARSVPLGSVASFGGECTEEARGRECPVWGPSPLLSLPRGEETWPHDLTPALSLPD